MRVTHRSVLGVGVCWTKKAHAQERRMGHPKSYSQHTSRPPAYRPPLQRFLANDLWALSCLSLHSSPCSLHHFFLCCRCP